MNTRKREERWQKGYRNGNYFLGHWSKRIRLILFYTLLEKSQDKSNNYLKHLNYNFAEPSYENKPRYVAQSLSCLTHFEH